NAVTRSPCPRIRSRFSIAREISASIARTPSRSARGVLPPDARDRRRRARTTEERQPPRLLERPQEPVVARRAREPGAWTDERPEHERRDAAAAALVARPLVEGDEDDGAGQPEQRDDLALQPRVTGRDRAVVHV